jgi:hypothetical protein
MSYRNRSTDFPSSPFRNKKFRLARFGVFFIMGLTVLGIGFSMFQSAVVTGSYVSCTVTDKDRTSDGDGGSDMRIYAEGCNGTSKTQVFTVADNIFMGEFASSNTFAEIKIGKTYDFETRGTRVPVLSLFENIVGVTEAK